MTGTKLVRERFALDDRTFTVLAEPWYDAASKEWKGRFFYLPLDRSLPHGVAGAFMKRAKRRDDIVRQLDQVSDDELARAFRAIVLPGMEHR